jgi:hypothetical protein
MNTYALLNWGASVPIPRGTLRQAWVSSSASALVGSLMEGRR